MRISIDASRRDIPPAVDWVSGLIGGLVDKRVAGFAAEERSNPLLTAHFEEHFALEYSLARARKYRKGAGRLPKGPEFDRLYSFLIPAHCIHRALPEATRVPFEGRLRDAVNGMHGARPFAYEIAIATHLMQKGWDVDFADYAGLAQFDLLARKASIEIEVECKTTSDDTGRRAHRQEVNRLCDLILPTTQQLADEAGCHLVKVVLSDRLEKSELRLSQTAAIIREAITQKIALADDVVRVEYLREELQSWPDPTQDPSARDFFEAKLGVKNAHLLIHGRPNFSVVVLAVTSAKPDSVIDAIADEAKKAAKQCSGTRPALVALNLVDGVSRPELETLLKTPNGLHAITHAVFRSEARLHVDSVAFTIPQTLQQDAVGTSRLSGQVLTLNNPSPKFVCDEVRTIFR